jgi:hypothetical protein
MTAAITAFVGRFLLWSLLVVDYFSPVRRAAVENH